MDKPSLLTKYDYSDRIDLTLLKIKEIDTCIKELSNTILIEGLFVTLIASFEICLSDLLQMDLIAQPKKLPKLELPFTKEEMLQGEKINIEIKKYVQSLGYKSIEEFMLLFQKTFNIKLNKWVEHKNKIIEFKARRNLLLHNDLKVNLIYIQQSGSCSLATEEDIYKKKKLNITIGDIREGVHILNELFADMKNALNEKMKEKTRIITFKRLWEYLFESSIMKFNDWLDVDENEDKIIGWKKGNKRYSNLSGSEMMFIDFISANFFFEKYPPRDYVQNWRLSYPMMRLLDMRRMEDFEFLIANFDNICKVIQRER